MVIIGQFIFCVIVATGNAGEHGRTRAYLADRAEIITTIVVVILKFFLSFDYFSLDPLFFLLFATFFLPFLSIGRKGSL